MASCEPCHPRVGGIWTWGQVIIWGGFYEGSLPPAPPLSTPPPPLPLPVCPMLAAGCPGLASAVRSHFPSPQWVRHSLLLSTPFSTHPPNLGGGGLERGRERREEGVWCECLLQRKLPPGLLCAPSHLSLSRSFQYYPRLCVCFQPGEEVEPDGRRIAGGRVQGEMVTAGLIWAPREKRLLTQEKLRRNIRVGDGERKLYFRSGHEIGLAPEPRT